MNSDSEQPERSDLVATLIRSAGRRAEPPPDAYPVVFAAAEATWRRKVARRRLWSYGVGIAATFVMLAVGTAFLRSVLPTIQAPPQVARVDGIGGEVQTRPKGAGAWVPVAARRLPLYAGTRLRTGPDGRADLWLEGGVSLRVATQTEIELQASDVVTLQRGAVYADTGSSSRNGIVISTPVGSARDLGTQFEVRFVTGELRVSVREGSVSLQRTSGDLGASAGERLTINAAGEVSRQNISRDDPDWAWAGTLVAMPDFDNQPVASLLAWVARGTDRRVRYADAMTEARAETVILHGQTGPLAPLDALRVLLSTTNFTYEILPDGTIEVRYN